MGLPILSVWNDQVVTSIASLIRSDGSTSMRSNGILNNESRFYEGQRQESILDIKCIGESITEHCLMSIFIDPYKYIQQYIRIRT